MSPAPVKSAIFNCVESIPSVTNSHKMLWRHRFLLLSCPESITVIPNSLAVISRSFTNFKKFRTTLEGSSVELQSLITYLPSFTLFTGFLLNKELNTNCFSLPLSLLTTMVHHICLTTWSSTFLLNSCALPLTSASFAFLHSVWIPLDNANSRIRPLVNGTLSRSYSVIPTLH